MVKKFETLMFDENCVGWVKHPTYNKMFIMSTERYMHDKCLELGWISLNEVYDALGVPRVLEAQIVGWTINEPVEFEIFIDPSKPENIVIHFCNLVKLL